MDGAELLRQIKYGSMMANSNMERDMDTREGLDKMVTVKNQNIKMVRL